MAMSYTSLSAAKSVSGSVANWVNYSELDVPVIIDEAQTLLYTLIRTREMLSQYAFTMPVGGSYIALPARFLDPVGRIRQASYNLPIAHKDPQFVERQRSYTETSGTLGADPFNTVLGSNSVSVTLANHGFNQDSLIYTSGASTFSGVAINGTFPITSITDTNTFVIDISSLGTTPTASAAGGGAAVAYVCDNLVAGMPVWFGIWNGNIYFDAAFTQVTLCKMQYYQSLPLLSSTNLTNFLTDRYPHVLRKACQASASDYMKDEIEHQKNMAELGAMVDRMSIENDMFLRGLELDTETP